MVVGDDVSGAFDDHTGTRAALVADGDLNRNHGWQYRVGDFRHLRLRLFPTAGLNKRDT